MTFERFSQQRLDELLVIHRLSPEGRIFLEKALEAPSRNVQGTRHNLASDLPCPKMRGNAQAESWSAENPFTLEHIFDSNTNNKPASRSNSLNSVGTGGSWDGLPCVRLAHLPKNSWHGDDTRLRPL